MKKLEKAETEALKQEEPAKEKGEAVGIIIGGVASLIISIMMAIVSFKNEEGFWMLLGIVFFSIGIVVTYYGILRNKGYSIEEATESLKRLGNQINN